MARAREKIEVGFARWAEWIAHRPWPVIIIMLGIALWLASRVPLLGIETSTEDYLFENDPTRIAFDAFREQFGRDQPILLAVEPPDVFDLDFLKKVEAIHLDIEENVAHLADVTSLVNVRSVYGVGDELFVDDLLEEMPTTPEALAAIERRVRSRASYQDAVISGAGRIALFRIEANAYSSAVGSSGDDDDLSGFDSGAPGPSSESVQPTGLSGLETAELCEDVLALVERHRQPDFVLHVVGEPMIAFALTRAMATDFPRMFGAALLLIGLMIVGLFRRVAPLLLAFSIVILSLLSTLGLSQLIGIPISLPTQILPIFVLSVGVGYSVHLMSLFFQMQSGTKAGRVGRGEALVAALRHVGPPILMTGVTTAAGLISFLAAEMQQVVQLGILAASSVVVTLVFALVLLPALLMVVPLRSGEASGPSSVLGQKENVLLAICARISVQHPWKVLGVALVLSALPIAWLSRFGVTIDPVEYFPETHWLHQGVDYVDTRAGGMMNFEIVIDTGRENGLHEPEVLLRIEALADYFEELARDGENVGRVFSFVDVLKETHQALNGNEAASYRVPNERALIAQELLLFENSGSEDLEKLVDSQFSKARFTVRTRWADGVETRKFIEKVTPRIQALIGDAGSVEITGMSRMMARIGTATAESLIQSYSTALALITPLMMLLIGSLRAGLISMVPNLLPILVTMGCVIGLGYEFDILMMLGGCIAIGLAVDDSIHFISSFRRELARTNDPARAVEQTMATTGRALLFTSIVLVAGFGVLGLSSMSNLAHLGWMTAGAIGLAFVLDVTVTPALLVLTHSKQSTSSRESAG